MTTQPRLEAPRIAGEEIRANFVKSVILIVIPEDSAEPCQSIDMQGRQQCAGRFGSYIHGL